MGVGVLDCAQYLPPVFNPLGLAPPQMTISLPLQTAVCAYRPVGALVVLVAVQLFVLGSYLPPVLKTLGPSHPPQTIISRAVHTDVCMNLAAGALVMLVAIQLFVPGL